jgi:hypothetical protein
LAALFITTLGATFSANAVADRTVGMVCPEAESLKPRFPPSGPIHPSAGKVRSAPELDPNIVSQPDLRRAIYEYYGYPSPA